MELNDPVIKVPGIGEKRAAQFSRLGIYTVKDLVYYFPRDYHDRSRIHLISEASPGNTITIEAEVVRARSSRLRGGKTIAILEVRDASATMKVSFFGRGFLVNSVFKPGKRFLFTGKIKEFNGIQLENPEYEPIPEDEEQTQLHTGRVVPIYGLTEGLPQKFVRVCLYKVLEQVNGAVTEIIPLWLRERHHFLPVTEAIRQIHFPPNMDIVHAARQRFSYEELLGLQVAVLRRRAIKRTMSGICHVIDGPLLRKFKVALPFELTPGQVQAINDILHDMASPRPMFRLLQGDVGCGKTLVMLHAIIAALDTGTQAVFMAPTEILAEQHYITLCQSLGSLGVCVELLIGATARAASIRKGLAQGDIQVVVGTHALAQEATQFAHLGLVIIDEQHRFGIRQRELLAGKGASPDILHATATPIPRTLAMTLYGGMDISVIPDTPPGRLPVKTAVVPDHKKEDLYAYLRDRAAEGYQSYIICPLVEESEQYEGLTPLINHFLALSEGPLAGLRCELLHGRLDAKEKESVMERFRNRAIDILFATTVIEVGIDSPTATTIVIEDAWRFGLTQLHQLRGRVGRSTTQSYCFLLGKPKTPDGKKRIKFLLDYANGFDIAEADLALRGPGEYCGLRQAGLSDLRVADLLRDARLLDMARRDAEEILRYDPDLSFPEHAALAEAAQKFHNIFI